MNIEEINVSIDALGAAGARIRQLERKNAALVEALQELVDHQNGCPLPKYEAGWNRAMGMARKALTGTEATL